jgi:hypothetical protein
VTLEEITFLTRNAGICSALGSVAFSDREAAPVPLLSGQLASRHRLSELLRQRLGLGDIASQHTFGGHLIGAMEPAGGYLER